MVFLPTSSGGPASSLQAGRYVAIDIGTLTCRMLIADIDSRGILHELKREYTITNLGEGVDATGELKEAAMQRVASVINGFLEVLKPYRAEVHNRVKVVAYTTSASRDARNANVFITMIEKLGIKLQVISGTREAELSFLGASSAFVGQNIMVVDVGGGSTEVAAGIAGAPPGWLHSFDLGSRRITEKFLLGNPPTPSELDRARLFIRQIFDQFLEVLLNQNLLIEQVVAVAGTATSVVSMREKMLSYDSLRVHKALVSKAQLDHLFHTLAGMTLAKRKKVVGLDPERAPVIVAGLMVLQEILHLSKRGSFTVSEADLLCGIVIAAAK